MGTCWSCLQRLDTRSVLKLCAIRLVNEQRQWKKVFMTTFEFSSYIAIPLIFFYLTLDIGVLLNSLSYLGPLSAVETYLSQHRRAETQCQQGLDYGDCQLMWREQAFFVVPCYKTMPMFKPHQLWTGRHTVRNKGI